MMRYSLSQVGSTVLNRVIEVRSANQLEEELRNLIPGNEITIAWENGKKTSGIAVIEGSVLPPVYIDLADEGKKLWRK